MVHKKDLTPITVRNKKSQVLKHVGKSAKESDLTGRPNTMLPGSPADRTMNDYAKASPMSAAPQVSQGNDLMGLGSSDLED